MSERPILFNSEMIKAILAGKKTITRRPVNPQPELINQAGRHSTYKYRDGIYALDMYTENSNILNKCPFGKVGDRLWVRETFRLFDADECPHSDFPCGCPSWGTPLYRASHDCGDGEKWKPSIHMPRWACRLILEITAIKIERLQWISVGDALAEGIQRINVDCSRDGLKTAYKDYEIEGITRNNPIDSFKTLWKKTYGAESWEKNEWVWVIEFQEIEGNKA